MENSTNADLRETVLRQVRGQLPDFLVEDVFVAEGFDEDDDRIVDVIVVLKNDQPITGFSSLTRSLWSELSAKNFGFPILSFRTSDENARLLASA